VVIKSSYYCFYDEASTILMAEPASTKWSAAESNAARSRYPIAGKPYGARPPAATVNSKIEPSEFL
jgi:hypothetical protein